jgi:hypothetical protein
MAIFGFNDESLRRHKVTHRECLEALVDPLRIIASSGESKAGNPIIIWVGMTDKERLLEVGIEYLEDMDWFYHASTAKAHLRRMYQDE